MAEPRRPTTRRNTNPAPAVKPVPLEVEERAAMERTWAEYAKTDEGKKNIANAAMKPEDMITALKSFAEKREDADAKTTVSALADKGKRPEAGKLVQSLKARAKPRATNFESEFEEEDGSTLGNNKGGLIGAILGGILGLIFGGPIGAILGAMLMGGLGSKFMDKNGVVNQLMDPEPASEKIAKPKRLNSSLNGQETSIMLTADGKATQKVEEAHRIMIGRYEGPPENITFNVVGMAIMDDQNRALLKAKKDVNYQNVDGVTLKVSQHGGMNVEENAAAIKKATDLAQKEKEAIAKDPDPAKAAKYAQARVTLRRGQAAWENMLVANGISPADAKTVATKLAEQLADPVKRESNSPEQMVNAVLDEKLGAKTLRQMLEESDGEKTKRRGDPTNNVLKFTESFVERAKLMQDRLKPLVPAGMPINLKSAAIPKPVDLAAAKAKVDAEKASTTSPKLEKQSPALLRSAEEACPDRSMAEFGQVLPDMNYPKVAAALERVCEHDDQKRIVKINDGKREVMLIGALDGSGKFIVEEAMVLTGMYGEVKDLRELPPESPSFTVTGGKLDIGEGDDANRKTAEALLKSDKLNATELAPPPRAAGQGAGASI